jgi:hypothetical protein
MQKILVSLVLLGILVSGSLVFARPRSDGSTDRVAPIKSSIKISALNIGQDVCLLASK